MKPNQYPSPPPKKAQKISKQPKSRLQDDSKSISYKSLRLKVKSLLDQKSIRIIQNRTNSFNKLGTTAGISEPKSNLKSQENEHQEMRSIERGNIEALKDKRGGKKWTELKRVIIHRKKNSLLGKTCRKYKKKAKKEKSNKLSRQTSKLTQNLDGPIQVKKKVTIVQNLDSDVNKTTSVIKEDSESMDNISEQLAPKNSERLNLAKERAKTSIKPEARSFSKANSCIRPGENLSTSSKNSKKRSSLHKTRRFSKNLGITLTRATTKFLRNLKRQKLKKPPLPKKSQYQTKYMKVNHDLEYI